MAMTEFDDDLQRKLRDVISSYRSGLPSVMKGLADRPSKGDKAAAREALTAHMREMHELALALGRIDPKPIIGS